ncbi:MerR family transcriptional regulator [Undibacterium rugosum]|uniref:MerR family transcriptional regulator n=1 Tax=Undibacterium rugosum TaxID=2762291 RepID=UPI001B83B733|nr:MerR family transcriptional regulator [Undibacterium rugosum]MBR7779231.1 MerR family transcriptional regulator [Undibacterium rugosum]
MDIGEVIQQSGIPASTLRYYEEKQLIRSYGRHGLRRQFDSSVLTQLALINLGQQAGFRLEQIATWLHSDNPGLQRELCLQQSQLLDQKIKELQAVRNALQHAAHCPATRHIECRQFQKLMRIALQRKRKAHTGAATV